MKKTIFKGSGVAIVTPMKQDFSVDYKVFGELIESQLEHKTDAIVVAGTTGEGSTLTDEEQMELVRFAVNCVKGRVPVIAGAGSNNTAHAVELSKKAEKAGADALLHVTPYYNKASQHGLFEHFKACACATDLPIILYNVPSRTGVNIQIETYRALCQIAASVKPSPPIHSNNSDRPQDGRPLQYWLYSFHFDIIRNISVPREKLFPVYSLTLLHFLKQELEIFIRP